MMERDPGRKREKRGTDRNIKDDISQKKGGWVDVGMYKIKIGTQKQ